MVHRFLLEPGRWTIEGNWLEKEQTPLIVRGRSIIAWNTEDWFTMVTKLVFPNGEREEISFQYRGRLGVDKRQYTYVLQQSLLGQVEGEGWISTDSIIQRYWAIGDRQRRSGFETFYRLNENTYHLSGCILSGHYLTSVMEAILERQWER